jgi:hypothetical protein
MVSASSVSAPGTATVTFMTTSTLLPIDVQTPRIAPWQLALLLLLAMTAILAIARKHTKLSLAACLILAGVLAGCSGGRPSTPTGQYQVSVAATSGGVTKISNVTLTVN